MPGSPNDFLGVTLLTPCSADLVGEGTVPNPIPTPIAAPGKASLTLPENKGTQTTPTDTYKFYLVDDGESNAAPFSAEAIVPAPGSSVSALESGTVTVRWEAEDSDNNTLTYTLLIDTVDGKQDPIADNQNLSTNTIEVTVQTNTIYYWSVITLDGSISVTSDVFSFRVD